jgi:hypothetical protein
MGVYSMNPITIFSELIPPDFEIRFAKGKKRA